MHLGGESNLSVGLSVALPTLGDSCSFHLPHIITVHLWQVGHPVGSVDGLLLLAVFQDFV